MIRRWKIQTLLANKEHEEDDEPEIPFDNGRVLKAVRERECRCPSSWTNRKTEENTYLIQSVRFTIGLNACCPDRGLESLQPIFFYHFSEVHPNQSSRTGNPVLDVGNQVIQSETTEVVGI